MVTVDYPYKYTKRDLEIEREAVIDKILEILDKYDLRDFDAYDNVVEYTDVNKEIRAEIEALKGGEQE